MVEGPPDPPYDPGAAISHIPALDGVRGVAIALVLALHFGTAADLPARSGSAVGAGIERLAYAGWSGVDLFFVLSGFLITTILLVAKGDPQYFRRFYARRVLRIFPLYYTALVLGLIVVPAVFPDVRPWLRKEGTGGTAWLWTYTVNIGFALAWIQQPIAYFSHFWTLAIEEQYYLVWPWLVKGVSERAVLGVCAVLIVSALVMRLAWVGLGFGWEGAYRFTLTRADSLAAGAALAVAMRNPAWSARLLKLGPAGLIAGLAGLAWMFLSVPRFYPSEWAVVTFGHSVVAATAVCLILVALKQGSAGWLACAALRSLGKYSYGIYVWHFPLQRALLEWHTPWTVQPSAGAVGAALVFLAAGIGGSVLLGWASYHVVERPFLRLKRFFEYAPPAVRGPGAVVPATAR